MNEIFFTNKHGCGCACDKCVNDQEFIIFFVYLTSDCITFFVYLLFRLMVVVVLNLR